MQDESSTQCGLQGRGAGPADAPWVPEKTGTLRPGPGLGLCAACPAPDSLSLLSSARVSVLSVGDTSAGPHPRV